MTPALPRVLLVEDDAAIRHFVSLSLETLALELHSCGSLEQAREALRSGPFALVLLDLMLPDGSGLELLPPALATPGGAATKWVVFSAGLTPEPEQGLRALGVWALLRKPVSVDILRSCVAQALAEAPDCPGADTVLPAPEASDQDVDARADAALPQAEGYTPEGLFDDGSDPAERAAVQAYFEGDRALFELMKRSTLPRLEADRRSGDAAWARSDAAALRRLAHSLKSVMRLIGRPQAALLAQRLEMAAQHGTRDEVAEAWALLRPCLGGAQDT